MKKEEINFIVSESKEQEVFVSFLRYHKETKDCVIALVNEGRRYVSEHLRLKRCGMRKGASDLFIALKSFDYAGLFVEMKRKKNYKISDEQKEFVETMRKKGYCAYVCAGSDSAIELVKAYVSSHKFKFSNIVFDESEVIDYFD